MNQFVGRVSFKHLVVDGSSVEDEGRALCLQFCAESDVKSAVFVFELGEIEGEPHAHFYFESSKGKCSIQNYLKRKFKLPPQVGIVFMLKIYQEAYIYALIYLVYWYILYAGVLSQACCACQARVLFYLHR